MLIKKIYFIICIIAVSFLAYQCGDNKKGNDTQGEEQEVENNQSATPIVLKGNPADGKEYFLQTCAACHGKDAKGLPKLGKDLTISKFVQEESNEKLVKFIEQGRLPSDPLNTTGVAMPPKGGNPALTDQQIIDIVSYLRSIHN